MKRRPKTVAKAAAAETPRESALTRKVEELAEVLRRHDLSELEVDSDGVKIRLSRGGLVTHVTAHEASSAPATSAHSAPPAAASPSASAAAAPAKAETSDGNVSYISSPFVGTFYRSPGPEVAPFVDVGTHVRKGQVLCIVEAMKLMNEIESEIEGTVLQVLVENGQPVEYGEPLFKIKQGHG